MCLQAAVAERMLQKMAAETGDYRTSSLEKAVAERELREMAARGYRSRCLEKPEASGNSGKLKK